MVIWALILASAVRAQTLEAGRAELAKENIAGALAAFKPIGPKSSAWPDKLEDLSRYSLLHGDPIEGWRILQLAHRTRGFTSSMADLERLALFRSRSCPLEVAPNDEVRGHLLNAATYRLLNNMFEGSPGNSADPSRETHLAIGLVPYLEDIPSMELLPDQGCRLKKISVHTREQTERAELRELVAYLDRTKDSAADRLLILMRAVELSISLKGEKLGLPSAEAIPWPELPEPERQWLFSKLFGGLNLEQVTLARRPQAQNLALTLLMAKDASPAWLAMIDLSTLTGSERVRVLSTAEKRGSFDGRAWVLFELAKAYAEQGDAREALTVLRRLVMEGEERVDPAMEDAVIKWASSLFIEYRHDGGLMGALRAAVPSRLWNALLEQGMAHAAFAGQSGEFQRLKTLREARLHYSSNSVETQLNEALARRDLARFKKNLSGEKFGGLESRIAEYAKKYVAYGFDLESRKNLLPYTQALISRIREFRNNEDEAHDLTVLLDENSTSAETSAGQAIHKGVERLGIARWKAPEARPPNLLLQPPNRLPRRELIYVPDVAGGRGWTLSTAVR